MVIQDDRFSATDSVTVVPLTSHAVDIPLLRLPVEPSRTSGLRDPSWVMIDKLTTVRRINVQDHLGRLSATQLVEIERSLLVFLGLAD